MLLSNYDTLDPFWYSVCTLQRVTRGLSQPCASSLLITIASYYYVAFCSLLAPSIFFLGVSALPGCLGRWGAPPALAGVAGAWVYVSILAVSCLFFLWFLLRPKPSPPLLSPQSSASSQQPPRMHVKIKYYVGWLFVVHPQTRYVIQWYD